MKKPIVSVLVPVYNVEKYLERCLDSILSQTLSDIEVICVNDGSTDNSADILEKYRLSDSRVKVITKENGGLPSARNAGLDAASGTYVGFVDSDDYIEPDMYRKLVEASKKDGADVVICGANIFPETPRASQWLYDTLSPKETHYTRFWPKVMFHRNDTTPFLWRTLIKRSIIEDNKLRLDEDIVLGEDKAFQCKVYPYASRITIIPDKLYNYYWCRPDSLMEKNVYEGVDSKLEKHVNLVERVANDIKKTKFEKKSFQANARLDYLNWAIPFIYNDFIKVPFSLKIKLIERIMKSFSEVANYYEFDLEMKSWKRDMYDYMNEFTKDTDFIPELSLVITGNSNSDYISDTLRFMEKIKELPIEIIFVNNGITKYAELLNVMKKNHKIRLINTPFHYTYAECLNDGVKRAVSDMVLFMDSNDCIKSKETLADWLGFAIKKNKNMCASGTEDVFDKDFHKFIYKRDFLVNNEIAFKDGSKLTGMNFLVEAVEKCGIDNISLYNKDIYSVRKMYDDKKLSEEKCLKLLGAIDRIIDISLANEDAELHGRMYTLLNSDEVKHMIKNCNMNSIQEKIVVLLYAICNKADKKLLDKYGYNAEKGVFDILCEFIFKRHNILGSISDRIHQ